MMKMGNRITKLVLILLIGLNVYGQETTTITGTIENNTDFEEISFENILSGEVLETVKIVDNKFKIESKIKEGDFYKISFSKRKYVLLVITPGEKISINIDIDNLFKPTIKGSKNSQLFVDVIDKVQKFEDEQKKAKEKIEKEQKKYLKDFILLNLNSLTSIIFINDLPIEENKDVYEKLDASLYKLYPNNSLVKELHEALKDKPDISVGKFAPEIALKNPEGKIIKLSSLKGKYVLIDFWAAWCGPCRSESPNMVEAYEKYNKKGFEIYSVSLDQNREDWLKAIKKDKLGKWTHVSDLKYWQCVAAKEYSVDGIPFTVLIDKEGKIIATGLRGKQLKQKLAEIFK